MRPAPRWTTRPPPERPAPHTPPPRPPDPRPFFAPDHRLRSAGGIYKWEFNLVESKEVNAWCMPGGKVVFYTGILPITKTEAGLAVVWRLIARGTLVVDLTMPVTTETRVTTP